MLCIQFLISLIWLLHDLMLQLTLLAKIMPLSYHLRIFLLRKEYYTNSVALKDHNKISLLK